MIEPLDYEAVGFMSGLEVHQQLLTTHKLFCRCPGGLYTETHDGEVLRHMRPTLSELGEYDGTALMEFKTKKEIIYLLNHLNVCTYEMDDTPPFLVNQEAIDISIELCLMMHLDIIDEVHIARKQYLDGSIPTGFQRTAIVGMNGWMPFRGRRLTVTHVSVEEDSCREVSDKGHRIVWRTDRLGMPLTETVTGPELRTPEEVRDAILLCGLTARSTRRVRTGIGASRQDVNVSVRGGSRVEIKGVPRAGLAVKLVHNEGVRQYNLLKLRDELHSRGLTAPDSIRVDACDVSDIWTGVDLGFIRRALESGGRVFAVRVDGVAGLAQHPTQPDTTFLDELAGRIRVIACLDDAPIVFSGALFPQFQGRNLVLDRVRKRAGVGANDDVFIVFGPEGDVRTAADEIRLRFADATAGVPKETRQALIGGYTTFERILPGPDRMYPDTDSPPTRVTEARVAAIRAGLKPAPWDALRALRRLARARGDDALPHPPRRRGHPRRRRREDGRGRADGRHHDWPAGQGARASRASRSDGSGRPSGSTCSTSTRTAGFRARRCPSWRAAWRRTGCGPPKPPRPRASRSSRATCGSATWRPRAWTATWPAGRTAATSACGSWPAAP